MKIQSRFQDFYDGIRAYGSDPRIFYDRTQREIKLPNAVRSMREYLDAAEALFSMPGVDHEFSSNAPSRLLCFCGKIFPVWAIRVSNKEPLLPWEVEAGITQPGSSLMNYIDPRVFLKDLIAETAYAETKTPYAHKGGWARSQKMLDEFDADKSRFRNTDLTPRNIANWKEEHSKKDYTGDCVKVSAPAFVLEHSGRYNEAKGDVNPNLKALGLSAIMTPQECYQELSMFIGNHLTGARPIPPVSDKDLITGKGFDAASFRMESPGAKRRKQRKHR